MSLLSRWKTFKVAAWLGWEMDSNWTRPWVFAVYSIVKPITGAFILVLMFVVFSVISGTQSQEFLDFFYVGNAFFIFVGSVLFGTFQVIHADREWYQTIRYVYIAPISFYTYIIGRAASKVLVSSIAVVVTLLFGVFALGVRVVLDPLEAPLFLAALAMGIFTVMAVGVTLGGISFITARHTNGMAEGLPGLFYLFCGVIFPLSVLPSWGVAIGQAIPFTYWFELTRRVLIPGYGATIDTTLQVFDNGTILVFLAVSMVAFFALSVGVFRLGEYLARRAGKLDTTTAY